jgi:cytochrome c oxidase assembly protein subunit 15
MRTSATLSTRILSPATAILLFLQSFIVVTGAAVRLTGSGLGCPTWPECVEGSFTPVAGQIEGQFHSWVEFANRLLTFVLALAALITLIAVLRARRRDLRLLAVGQVLGILGQGVLGGITVLTDLNPLTVAAHFLLSTILIAAATSLYTRRHRPARKKESQRTPVIFSRAHVSLTAIVIILGTIVTGAGPHAGDIDTPRLDLRIQSVTLVHGVAVAILLLLTLFFFLSPKTEEITKKRLAIFGLLNLAQGAIGVIQYIQGVPELLVAAHILGSIIIWISAWSIWLSVQREEMDIIK